VLIKGHDNRFRFQPGNRWLSHGQSFEQQAPAI
jgi:hypothetical protein